MNNDLLIAHLKQLQQSFKAIYELWEINNSHENIVNGILSDNYPFEDDFGEMTLKVVNWTNNAIDEL